MLFNPLLDCTIVPVPLRQQWWQITENLCKELVKAAVKNNTQEALNILNVLDLIDTECAAYWRDTGFKLYKERKEVPCHAIAECPAAVTAVTIL